MPYQEQLCKQLLYTQKQVPCKYSSTYVTDLEDTCLPFCYQEDREMDFKATPL